MNKANVPHGKTTPGDAIAIAVQELKRHRKLDHDQPLFRIDYRREAAGAPFQFDAAEVILHRTGCSAIPEGSRSALYAVWHIAKQDTRLGCKKCRPMPKNNSPPEPLEVADVLFGLLSLVDQFRTVLSERGQEYRQTQQGRELERSLSGLLARLNERQQQGVNLIASTMDKVLWAVEGYNQTLNGGSNGAGRNSQGRTRRRRPAAQKNPRARNR